MKKILLVLLLVAALSALLASCGGETTTASTTAQTPVTTEDPRLVGAYDNPENHLTLPALKDVVVDSAAINKTVDNDILSFLKTLGKTAYTVLPEGTAAVSGNTVNIHYTGRAKDPSVTLSENNLKGMTNASDSAGYNLTLGSGAFIPGFEEQLIGAKKGDKIAVDVSFPKNYGNEELNGLAVIFDVTVNEVYETKVSAENELTVYATYTLVGEEANTNLSAFLLQHKTTLDMKNLTAKYDNYFDASVIAEALLGKNLLDEVTLTLTLSKEDAATYGYDKELTLTAKLYIADVVIYPTELTDADVNTNTNGTYKTVAEYRQYLFDYYKVSATYDTLVEKAVYADIPKDVFDALYEDYYAVSLKNQIGDITKMTPEELDAKLTETVKKTAEEFATKNALAEWKDKILIAYLEKTSGFTYTEETYQKDLKELYDYYCEYEAYLLYYYGINSVTDFEALFDNSYGAGYLRNQLKNDALLTKISELVSYS